MKLFQKSRSIKGSVLVFSLIILAFMLVSALSVAVISTTEKRASLATDKSNRAFQVADTGAEAMLQKIYKGSYDSSALSALGSCSGGDISDASAGYRVSFYKGDGTKLTDCSDTNWRSEVAKIKSEGVAGNTKRAVEVGIKSPEVCLVPSVNYGGDTYDTTTIGTQCWMKRNMNIGTRINVSTAQSQAVPGIEKYCYGDNQTNCDVTDISSINNQPDGGLYQWDEAMQYDSSDPQGICPSGWHIPTDSEWYTLENYLRNYDPISFPVTTCDATRNGPDCYPAGNAMSPGFGLYHFEGNRSGFSFAGSFAWRGTEGYFWSSSQSSSGIDAMIRHLSSGSNWSVVYRDPAVDKRHGYSVRCLQD